MNQNPTAADAYRRAALENAPPIKVIRLLYQGALRFLDEAAAADPATSQRRFQDRLHRAEAIVVELRISLEKEHAPELCSELERLYLFVEDKLREAVQGRTVEPITAARSVLNTLYSAWRDIQVDGAKGEAA